MTSRSVDRGFGGHNQEVSGRYTMSSSPFEREKNCRKSYSRGRKRLDQSSLKRFLKGDSMGSSTSDSLEILIDIRLMISKTESESPSVIKVELNILGNQCEMKGIVGMEESQ